MIVFCFFADLNAPILTPQYVLGYPNVV